MWKFSRSGTFRTSSSLFHLKFPFCHNQNKEYPNSRIPNEFDGSAAQSHPVERQNIWFLNNEKKSLFELQIQNTKKLFVKHFSSPSPTQMLADYLHKTLFDCFFLRSSSLFYGYPIWESIIYKFGDYFPLRFTPIFIHYTLIQEKRLFYARKKCNFLTSKSCLILF